MWVCREINNIIMNNILPQLFTMTFFRRIRRKLWTIEPWFKSIKLNKALDCIAIPRGYWSNPLVFRIRRDVHLPVNHVFLHEGNNLLICNAALIEVWISGNENSVFIRRHSSKLCICSESLWIIRAIERLRKDIYNSSVRFTGQLPLRIHVHFFADNLFPNLIRQVF